MSVAGPVAGPVARLVAGLVAWLVAGLVAWLVAGLVARPLAESVVGSDYGQTNDLNEQYNRVANYKVKMNDH